MGQARPDSDPSRKNLADTGHRERFGTSGQTDLSSDLFRHGPGAVSAPSNDNDGGISDLSATRRQSRLVHGCHRPHRDLGLSSAVSANVRSSTWIGDDRSALTSTTQHRASAWSRLSSTPDDALCRVTGGQCHACPGCDAERPPQSSGLLKSKCLQWDHVNQFQRPSPPSVWGTNLCGQTQHRS